MPNRPMIGKAPAQRYNVSLPPEVAEAVRKIGDGNLSEGIRIMERQHPKPFGKKRRK